MKILFATDICGNLSKYDELVNTVQFHKPQFVIISGILSGSNDIFLFDKIKIFLDKINNICPILIQVGGLDTEEFENYFDENISNDNLINISNQNIEFDDIVIAGNKYVPDHPFRLKDRVRRDHTKVKHPVQLESPVISTKTGIKPLEDLDFYLTNRDTIEDELKKKIESIKDIKKTIWVSYAPPSDMMLDILVSDINCGSVDVWKLANGDLTNNDQPSLILSGWATNVPKYTYKWFEQHRDCCCVQPGQSDDNLNCVLINMNDSGYAIYHSKYFPKRD